MTTITSLFAAEGRLVEQIPGFRPRAVQTQMAEAVQAAMTEKTQLLVEACTGTGKTFAYLVPALSGKAKVIISTGSKNLQEQLFHRDLPLMKQALGVNKQTALLKGRSNYLCTHRLSQHGGNSTLLESDTLSQLSEVRRWANTTSSGDIGELKTLPEDAKVLPLVTSTVDNCLGKDCPDYNACYLVKARRKAMDAELVVVNHHLFFADLGLKDTGFGELIPEAGAVVFDEAHQIPDIASEYFGEALSSRQLHDIAKEINLLYRGALKDIQQLAALADKLSLQAADLRILFPHDPERGNWFAALQREAVQAQITRVASALKALYEAFKLQLGRDEDLDNLYERVVDARAKLQRLSDREQTGVSLWYETTPKHIVLRLTPLSVAEKFTALTEEPKRAWIFTSATLAVGGGFAHFQRQMGLESAQTLALDSPFDYQRQSLLCIPRYLPEPNQHEFSAALTDLAKRLIVASRGRCFLLFTSHAMLRRVADNLSDSIDNPILVQGSASKGSLLTDYIAKPNAVLLGTSAFWEGVDVKGDALTCVMIDKLPFASPDDPLLQARIEDCRKRGGNPFAELQLPRAVIALKQGAGRLIRDAEDSGVLVICDNRLVNRDYGKTFIQSMPDMMRTRDPAAAEAFLEKLHATN